jgi:hypothetical protein
MPELTHNAADSAIAARPVEVQNMRPLAQELWQSSTTQVEWKKTGNPEPKTGYLDLSDPYDKKQVAQNSESTKQAHKITPEEQKKIEEAKKAISAKIAERELTPEELKAADAKHKKLKEMGGIGMLGATSSMAGEALKVMKDGKYPVPGESTKPVADAKPVDKSGIKFGDKETKAELKDVDKLGDKKNVKQTEKLTQEQIDAIIAKKKAAEASNEKPGVGERGKPVDSSDKKPVPTESTKPAGNYIFEKPKPIDMGHQKPKPGSEKPPNPKGDQPTYPKAAWDK